MATLDEWQARLDQDFPRGAHFYRSDWIDPWDDTPDYRKATGLHLIDIQNGFPRLFLIDANDDDFGWIVSIMSYAVQSGTKHKTVKIRSKDGEWTAIANVPDKITGTEQWKSQRVAERENARKMGESSAQSAPAP